MSTPTIFFIAGEPSGDAIGGRLLAALKDRLGDQVSFAGIGGEAMTAQGLKSLFPMSELSVMGVVEVLPRVARIFGRMRQTAREIQRIQPDAVISIDAPAFCWGVWRRLRGDRPCLIHYVAPTVWAWRPGRAAKYAQTIDHLLALLPFEPPYFEAEGLPCTFVGHPVVEFESDPDRTETYRRRHDLERKGPICCVLPGSRRSEVRRLLPVFGDAIGRLRDRYPDLAVIAPTTPALASAVEQACNDWNVSAVVEADPVEKYAAMAACDLAIAASGTVALELALLRVPMIITYRVNAFTAGIVRRMLKVRHVCLINLLLDRAVVPELLQEDCRADRLSGEMIRLIEDKQARQAQIDALEKIEPLLRGGSGAPSLRAADVIINELRKRQSGEENWPLDQKDRTTATSIP